MTFWLGRNVMVTGGNGFLGRHVVERLRGLGAYVMVPTRDTDLRETISAESLFRYNPDVIIHLAALAGGIQKNIQRPADMFYDNMKMGMEIIHAGKRSGVKIVVAGSACEYPKVAPVPLKEESLWSGYPEETNGSYGIAKRALGAMGQAYRAQYGTNVIHLVLANMYGPFDNFGEGSHFIPAMIKKCMDKERQSITFWGTGQATRDMLYVGDAVDGVLLAAEHYNEGEPVNIGTGRESTISNIAYKIAVLTGYKGRIDWDGTTTDGQPRRVLDVSRAKEKFGFEADTLLEAGLSRTIEWYGAQLRSSQSSKG
jgi:GDP-L-fucose synthase